MHVNCVPYRNFGRKWRLLGCRCHPQMSRSFFVSFGQLKGDNDLCWCFLHFNSHHGVPVTRHTDELQRQRNVGVCVFAGMWLSLEMQKALSSLVPVYALNFSLLLITCRG